MTVACSACRGACRITFVDPTSKCRTCRGSGRVALTSANVDGERTRISRNLAALDSEIAEETTAMESGRFGRSVRAAGIARLNTERAALISSLAALS